MSITVYSLDFDGCLSNHSYLLEGKSILEANEVLINLLKSTSGKKVVFVGSNRQSLADDYYNGSKSTTRFNDQNTDPQMRKTSGSCYPAIQQIAAEIEAEFDPFLLADLFNNLPAGTALNEAIAHLAANQSDYQDVKGKMFSNWIHDSSKLTMLYAQMHKIAMENPEEDIDFNFYDDKKSTESRDDLLNKLHHYFTQYPQLIPSNVRLKLHHYKGPVDDALKPIDPLIFSYEPIQGQRTVVDTNFRLTVKQITAVTLEESPFPPVCGSSAIPMNCYSNAARVKFDDISPISCIDHYKPGMVPNETLLEPSNDADVEQTNDVPKKRRSFRASISNLITGIPTLVRSTSTTHSTAASSTSSSTSSTAVKDTDSINMVRESRSENNLLKRFSSLRRGSVKNSGSNSLPAIAEDPTDSMKPKSYDERSVVSARTPSPKPSVSFFDSFHKKQQEEQRRAVVDNRKNNDDDDNADESSMQSALDS